VKRKVVLSIMPVNPERFKLPAWSREPQLDKCALEVFKGEKKIGTITRVRKQKATIFGRHKSFADVILQHPSISRQHSAILHGKSGNMYVMDLGSSHGTFVNKRRLANEKREPLREGDKIRFGASSREYIVRLCLEKDSRRSRKRSRERSRSEEKKRKKKKRKLESVGCSHLLVKHEKSRRPSSWREKTITRTKEEALELIKKYKKEIEEADDIKEKFKEFATDYSDCNSHSRGGDLGKFKRGKMQKPFEECAFSLKVGELSSSVETASGVHLILRTS